MDNNKNPKAYRPNKLDRTVTGPVVGSTADFDGQYPSDLEALFSNGGDTPKPTSTPVSIAELNKGSGGKSEGG